MFLQNRRTSSAKSQTKAKQKTLLASKGGEKSRAKDDYVELLPLQKRPRDHDSAPPLRVKQKADVATDPHPKAGAGTGEDLTAGELNIKQTAAKALRVEGKAQLLCKDTNDAQRIDKLLVLNPHDIVW